MKRLLFVLALVAGFTSCKREFDEPPNGTIPEGSLLTIDDLRQMYVNSEVRFTNDETVYCVVTADETSGNLYRNVYVQDPTGAINLRLLNSGGLYEGDSIRINLNGTVLSEFNGVLQLDSVDVDRNIVKQATGIHVEPTDIDITQVSDAYESMLVRFTGVQFASTDTSETFADAVNQFSENRMLENCAGDQVIVRTSGYSNFADAEVPNDNGTLVGILGQYQTDYQVYIRDLGDVNMDNTRCQGSSNYLSKDFEDLSISSGGWTQQLVVGSTQWIADSFSGDNFGKISNFNGTSNSAAETWYISPAVDLSTSSVPVLTFRSACNYNGAQLEVYASTDYDGTSAPSTATWTMLNPTLSSGSWAWVNSGTIDMTSYKTSGVYIAFKYTGSNSDGKTWEIDDILITEM